MKNKPLTILLLLVVTLIWGNVIYKFIKNIGNTDIEWLSNEMDTDKLIIPSVKELDFQLILDYNDPFLVTRKKTISSNSSQEEIAFEKAFEDEINPSPKRSINEMRGEIKSQNNYGGKNSVNSYERKKIFEWPNISYHGIVKRTDNKNSGLLMVKFNNQLINIRQGEYFMGDFKITRCWRDSIQIINERLETKTFYR